MSRLGKRRYASQLRSQAAEATKARVLDSAKKLFARRGIDGVTIAQIAKQAGVAPPTIYALFKSKEGILRAVMRGALFGPQYEKARQKLDGVTDPVSLIALSAQVARAIYESESVELGLIRGVSAFSPALRKLEEEFEALRYDMQEERIKLLFRQAKQRKKLEIEDARLVLWMYTSRDVYRMLVYEGGWNAEQYQRWLSDTLLSALVSDEARKESSR